MELARRRWRKIVVIMPALHEKEFTELSIVENSLFMEEDGNHSGKLRKFALI